MNPEKLEAEIMKLSPSKLDAPSEEENLQLWVQVAQRRLNDLREGKAKAVPAEDVFQRARTAILCAK